MSENTSPPIKSTSLPENSTLERLSGDRNFKTLRSSQQKAITSSMIVVISPTLTEKSGIVRYGISASKRIGNAVARNKLKRRFRAAIKEVYPEKFVAGYDYLMIGRKYGVDCNFEALLSDLRKALNYLKKQV